jgi:hypothetical protein
MVSMWPDDGSLSRKPVAYIRIKMRSVGCDCAIGNSKKYINLNREVCMRSMQ